MMKKPKEKVEGNRILQLLEIKSMSQSELCALSGLDKSHVSRIINNKTMCVSLPIAYKISLALDEPIENVFILKY
jgi:transcriptional regulator with XRE-family HTH domain